MAATFTFCFVAIGQGDCCLVLCPDNRVVVVDCGMTSNHGDVKWTAAAKATLRGWAAANGDRVAALILTHPDKDHHNKVVEYFTYTRPQETLASGRVITFPTRRIGIDEVYISNAYRDDGPLAYYTEGGLNNAIYNLRHRTGYIHDVTINRDDAPMVDAAAGGPRNQVRSWSAVGGFRAVELNVKQVVNHRCDVLHGNNEGTPWSVEIIAGNVGKMTPEELGGTVDAATEDNAKSLITLFTVGGRKALLCGDATFSTEKFLLDVQGAAIADVELVQIPHHGSDNASGPGFIDVANPRNAVVSAGYMETPHLHPRYERVLEPWMDKIDAHEDPIEQHLVDYWSQPRVEGRTKAQNDRYSREEVRRLLLEWTTNETDFARVFKSGNFTFLRAAPPDGGVFGVYETQGRGMTYYRENANTCRLRETSQANQVYYLTEDGIVEPAADAGDDADEPDEDL